MRRSGRRGRTLLLALLTLLESSLPASTALADEPDRLTFQAARVDADPTLHTVDLQGSVRLRYGRYRFSADRLSLRFADDAVAFEGEGRVALCPCPDAPITFVFKGGRFSPPGDLLVRFPRVELFGVPVFALPILWLRGPDQLGVLPPIVAYRGASGLLLGAGLHVPLPRSAEGARSLDLRAAAYVQGGAEIGAFLSTPRGRLRIVADEIRGHRVVLDAAGSTPAADRPDLDLAWDLDAVRGDRARSGTVDLGQAAQPFDSAAAAVIARAPTAAASALISTGVLGRSRRGEGPLVIGPWAGVSLGGPLARLGSWSADAEGLALGNALPGSALPIGRAAIRAELDARKGPLRLRVESGGRAAIAGDRPNGAPSLDVAIGARFTAELPLVRAYGGAPGEAPLVHWIAPALDLGVARGVEQGRFFQPLGLLASPGLALASAGLSTALGRFAGPSLRLDLRGGALASAAGTEPLIEGRLRAEGPIASASLITVAVTRPASPAAALLAHLRLGASRGPTLRLDLAGASSGDARAARLLAGWTSAVPLALPALLAAPGWTVGAETSLPFTETLRGALGGTLDAGTGELYALRARGDYRHPCGCLALGLTGSRRLGREGVDLILSVDLGASAPAQSSLVPR